MRVMALLVAACAALTACTVPVQTATPDSTLSDTPGQRALDAVNRPARPAVLRGVPIPSAFPPAPSPVPTGPLAPAVQVDLDEIVATFATFIDLEVVERVAASGDVRVLWHLADLLRFTQERPEGRIILRAFEDMTGVVLDPTLGSWTAMSDHLLAWDLPAAPGYVEFKAGLLTQLEPGWQPFFDDPDADVDWREVGWGGVQIDARALGDDQPCSLSCIPALDDPVVVPSRDGDWYADDGLVFAVSINGQSRAYPKHMMEVHELVNDTIGGVRIAIPYCTLCGSAQAYVTQGVVAPGVDEPLVLRTSGLLRRSNKVVFDLGTRSMFDTFSGVAVTGPLREAKVRLPSVTTVVTTWGEWRAAHPQTTILAEDPGTGRTYDLNPLGTRDDDGPIFPIGDVDPRLPVQAAVVGVVLGDGTTVAFDAVAARASLAADGIVAFGGISLVNDGGGLRAVVALDTDVVELSVHESFWFAWSQRHPSTLVWTTEG